MFFEKPQRSPDQYYINPSRKRTLRDNRGIPKKPTQYTPYQIRKIREYGNYSQSMFALIMGVSVKTIQAYENGRRRPSQQAFRLLEFVLREI